MSSDLERRADLQITRCRVGFHALLRPTEDVSILQSSILLKSKPKPQMKTHSAVARPGPAEIPAPRCTDSSGKEWS